MAPAMLGGESTVYPRTRGSPRIVSRRTRGLRRAQDQISKIRDLGERVLAVGQLRTRGTGSGAEVESPMAYVVEFKNGKIIRIDDFFDPKEALEAAGLRE